MRWLLLPLWWWQFLIRLLLLMLPLPLLQLLLLWPLPLVRLALPACPLALTPCCTIFLLTSLARQVNVWLPATARRLNQHEALGSIPGFVTPRARPRRTPRTARRPREVYEDPSRLLLLSVRQREVHYSSCHHCKCNDCAVRLCW